MHQIKKTLLNNMQTEYVLDYHDILKIFVDCYSLETLEQILLYRFVKKLSDAGCNSW